MMETFHELLAYLQTDDFKGAAGIVVLTGGGLALLYFLSPFWPPEWLEVWMEERDERKEREREQRRQQRLQRKRRKKPA